jgi:hypothetical protein
MWEEDPASIKRKEQAYERKNEELAERSAPIANYCPDCQPSFSRAFRTETAPDEIRQVLQVRGVGVVVIRSNRTTRCISMSIITKDEVGPCPEL